MSLYERLEVQKGASGEEIKKAYMKMARKHHPDKGGDAEIFKGMQEAYEVLTDEKRRQIYDMTGSIDGVISNSNSSKVVSRFPTFLPVCLAAEVCSSSVGAVRDRAIRRTFLSVSRISTAVSS